MTLAVKVALNRITTNQLSMRLGKEPFQNIVGKGETSIFSFSHNVFYSIKDRKYLLCYISFVVCKWFQSGQGQIFVIWELIKVILPSLHSYLASDIVLIVLFLR